MSIHRWVTRKMSSFSRSHHIKRSSSNESSSQNNPQYSKHDQDDISKHESAFECNICLETARDAVVSMCGHLFCWPCLYQWMYATETTSQGQKTCPVCKSAISRERTIPIYGRSGNESNRQDPRDKLPPRPSGQRSEVPNQPNQFPYGNVWAMGGPGAQIFGFGDGGFHMSFWVNSMPQYILAFMQEMMLSDRRNDPDFFLMKFFAICGFLCILLTLYFC